MGARDTLVPTLKKRTAFILETHRCALALER